jgi:hypothetical protein
MLPYPRPEVDVVLAAVPSAGTASFGDSVQITGLYSWGPPEIASRVEIDVVGQYLKPYLDTIHLGGIRFNSVGLFIFGDAV